MHKIKVPCSSANLGPGFDCLGMALKPHREYDGQHGSIDLPMILELQFEILASQSTSLPYNCEVTCEGQGSEDISLAPHKNLITQVALYVLRTHGHNAFPSHTRVHIVSGIPLSRGLGSSGAAVVAVRTHSRLLFPSLT